MTPPFPVLLNSSIHSNTNNDDGRSVVLELNGGTTTDVAPLRRRTTYDQQQSFKAHYLDDFSWFGSNNKKRDFRRAIRSWSGYGTLSGTNDDLTVNTLADPTTAYQQQGCIGGGASPLLGGGNNNKRRPQIIPTSADHSEVPSADGRYYQRLGGAASVVRLGTSATSPVPLTHATSVGSVGASKKTKNSLWTMPGIKSLVSRRRNSGGNLDVSSTNSTASTTSPTAPLMTRRNNNNNNISSQQSTTSSNAAISSNSGSSMTTNIGGLIKPEISISSASGITTSFNPHHHHQQNSSGSSSSLLRPAALLGSLVNLRFGLSHTLRSNVSSGSSSSIEPLQPINRLRVSPHGSTARMCSRCSSLLTLATAGSRYSLDRAAGHGFVPVRAVSGDDVRERSGSSSNAGSCGNDEVRRVGGTILCKMCLEEVKVQESCALDQCHCCFCLECMRAYVKYEISQGAYDISCPDAQCPAQGTLAQHEIRRLAGNELLEKHLKYRLNREVEIDKSRMWCPRAGCETVCQLCATSQRCEPQSVHCPTCTVDFCSNCKLEWHAGMSCDDNTKQLAKEGRVEEAGIPFDSDLIKCCPMCKVPIEKDEGCAQMMCKRCKHVFCWYCLASLDDDFLLRHYDKGPCKNKLGHSRASVIWHRTQVITIFAGFGILLLVASPLLLLAAPCIVCCKCRVCNAGTAAAAAVASSSASKLEEENDDDDDEEDDVDRLERRVRKQLRKQTSLDSLAVEVGGIRKLAERVGVEAAIATDHFGGEIK